jgi:hypothetical protein
VVFEYTRLQKFQNGMHDGAPPFQTQVTQQQPHSSARKLRASATQQLRSFGHGSFDSELPFGPNLVPLLIDTCDIFCSWSYPVTSGCLLSGSSTVACSTTLVFPPLETSCITGSISNPLPTGTSKPVVLNRAKYASSLC